MFENIKIIVSSEAEKQVLLKGCKHIHDFSVFFQGKVEVIDEFGVDNDMDKKDCDVAIDMDEEDCGVCLNFDKYTFVNFLAGLYDCEDKSVRDDFIKVKV